MTLKPIPRFWASSRESVTLPEEEKGEVDYVAANREELLENKFSII
jgi:hypothetical protein